MLMVVPEALKRLTVGIGILNVSSMSLTNWPAAVGFAIKLESITVRELVPVVMVAAALSGPSPPVPEAVKVKVLAWAPLVKMIPANAIAKAALFSMTRLPQTDWIGR
jgi:hypothetical protein